MRVIICDDCGEYEFLNKAWYRFSDDQVFIAGHVPPHVKEKICRECSFKRGIKKTWLRRNLEKANVDLDPFPLKDRDDLEVIEFV